MEIIGCDQEALVFDNSLFEFVVFRSNDFILLFQILAAFFKIFHILDIIQSPTIKIGSHLSHGIGDKFGPSLFLSKLVTEMAPVEGKPLCTDDFGHEEVALLFKVNYCGLVLLHSVSLIS